MSQHGARPPSPTERFIETVEKYGGLYKWWLEYDGNLKRNPKRAIEYCVNRGMIHRVELRFGSTLGIDDVIELFDRFVIMSTKTKFTSMWTFVEFKENNMLVFLLENSDDAILLQMIIE